MVTIQQSVRHALFVFLVIFTVHGAIAFRGGVHPASDSAWYDVWSTRLAHRFDYGAIQNGHYSFMLVTRFGFLTLLAVTKVIAGAAWTKLLLFVNVVCDALTGVLVVRTTWRVTQSLAAAWVSFLLFLVSFEIFQWTRYVLTDTPFLLLSFATIVCCVEFAIAEDLRARRRLAVAIAALFIVAMLFRPTAVVLVPVVCVTVFVATARDAAARSRRMSIVAVAIVTGALVVAFAEAWILQKPSRWPFRALSQPVAVAAHEYGTGQVVFQRVETYHRPPKTILDYVAITADRFVHFFQFTSTTNSRLHNLINVVTFVPLYLFAFVAAVGSRRTAAAGPVFILVVTVVAFAVFHSLTQVDWDWRYRLPTLPPLIVLASTGVQIVLARVFVRASAHGVLSTASF